MSGPLSTENSVKAKTHNQPAFDEGEALEELEPGQGVVRGNGGFEPAGADSPTKRVVREQRNPGGRGIEDDESPLTQTYPAESNVETLGFQSHDQARLLVDDDGTETTVSEGDELAWGADGYLVTDGTDTVAVAANDEDVVIEADGGPVHVLVEFI